MIKINPSILSKTVKAITPKTEKVEEAQIRGTIVFRNNEQFVQLDGAPSNALTPIADFAEGASDAGFVHGDRVLVLIKNHQAIVTKNLTTGLQAQAAKEASAFTTAITDEGITAQRIIANDTFTNTLRANHITADEIIAGMATIDTLDANYAHITNGVIDNAKIGVADVNDLSANYAHITQGVIDNAKIGVADVNDLSANYAHITEGVIDNAKIGVADVNDLSANYAHITQGVIDNAKIGYADVDDLNAHYATIDIANVNNAWIENGAIKKAEVFDENVFDLSGNRATLTRIDASKINVANLRADNLVVRRINGQPVVGGYTLIDSSSPGYSSKNPQALGWYEFVNAQWVLSTDTTVDMTKAYYQEGNEVSLYDQAYIDSLENDLQQQIDGAVETFTGSVVPTLTNYPYTDWYDTSVTPIHDERAKHVGDIYYVVNSAADENGYCYRFAYDNTSHAYSWVLIKDSDVTKALSDISDLQTFESETTSWIDETDQGLETIRTNHTSLVGVVNKTVKESVQLWFTKANTTAPSKPTAEVTSTSTAGNAWRKVVPAYNASYPHYYYCWQYKFVDGTFGWSDVVRDIAMGETQGTARDAKNTADAALPASTFTTFESTTFKNVKDTVDEQTTKFTNMTTRLGLNSDGTGANTDIVAKESALEQTVDGISTRVGKTEAHLIGMYATSSTAAGTAAKVATITPAIPSGTTWELSTGTTITVKFTNANTTASPTLNVNSKGAKPIKTYANGNLTEAEYKWKAGSTFTFTYNGINWLMQDSTSSVRMNSAETGISQNAEQIALRAKSSDVYTKGQVYTKTETDSAITTKAGEISLSVAQTEIGKIEVGGRNLLIENGSDPSLANHTITNTTTTDTKTYFDLQLQNMNSSKSYVNLLASEYKTYDSTGHKIWTFKVANTTQSNGYIKFKHNGSSHDIGVLFKFSKQLLAGDIVTISFDLDGCNPSTVGGLIIKNIKLETGNKATDWTPAPEDIEGRVDTLETFKSEFTVTPSAISSEVQATQNGETLVSRINQTADTVKIQAKHVEIDGTTTFNAIKSNVESTAQAAVDDIEVGGRNYAITTLGNIPIGKTETRQSGVTATLVSPAVIKLNGTATSTDWFFSSSNVFCGIVLEAGVYACWATTPNVSLRVGKGSNSAYFTVIALGTKDEPYLFNITESDTYWFTPNCSAGKTFSNQLVKIMIEKGNKATDWTPAPEDVQSEIDAKKSVHTLMSSTGGSTYANILTWTAEGRANTSWDINTTATPITNIKVGDTVRVAYKVTDMNNAYVYVIGEFESSSGSTVYLTMHGLDTTIIDGGNILTNSIGANKIKVNELTIGQSQVSGLSTALANTEKLYKHNIDLTGSSYNQNTWYPVLIGDCPETDASIYFKCSIVNGGGTPSWSSHSSKHWACEVEASYSVSRWGWKSDTNSYIDAYTFGQTSTKPIVLSNALSNTGYLVVYLRGGGYYPIQTSIADTPQIKTSSYTVNSQTVAPTTTQPANTENFVISRREGDTKTNEAATTATNYIAADSSGIRIASANPATQYQRIALTSSRASFYSSDNVERVAIDSSVGVVVGRSDKGHTVVNDDGLSIYDVTNKKRSEVTKNGLNVLDTDGSTSVASFGASARIGKEADSNIVVTSASITGDSGDGEYFDISNNGGQLTTITYATTSQYGGTGARTIDLTSSVFTKKWNTIANGGAFKVKIVYKYKIRIATDKYSYGTRTVGVGFTKGTASTSNTYATYNGASSLTLTSSYPAVSGGTYLGRNSVSLGKVETTATPLYRFGHEVSETGGAYGFTVGHGTKTFDKYQLACGEYNTSYTDAYFMVGNGSSDSARSNAFVVDKYSDVLVGGTIVHTSDRRLKKHISYLDDDAIEFINKLKPVHFIKGGKKQVGFYAQDVAEIDKWKCMIGDDLNGYMTLNYEEIIAPLVTYVQKLEKRIEELEGRR